MNYEEYITDNFNENEKRIIYHIARKIRTNWCDTDIAVNKSLEIAIEQFKKDVGSL